jgi:hypothetical protein
MLCFGHVAAYFLSKRFYILEACIIFHEIMFFIALYFIHGALFHSWRFISFMALYFSFHGPFFLFRALYFSCIAPFCSCIALYSDFLCESALVFSPIVSQRAILLSFQIVM